MGDGSLLTPKSGVLVKKAPGNVLYDFGQFIPLPFMNGWEKSKVDYLRNFVPKPMNGFLT